MKPLKTIAVAALLTIAWFGTALAQFAPTPSPKAFRPTYQASTAGLTNSGLATASTSDFFTIQGSATKIVTVTEISCTGTATALSIADILLIKRSTADTGTSVTLTNVPNDSGSPAATALVKTWATTPTPGTPVGTIRASKFLLAANPTPAVTPVAPLRWQFGDSPYEQAVVLRGVAQTLALGVGAAALAAGAAVNCNVTWTEN